MSDTEDTAAAMAEAMGFSSFGSQIPPSKRRRFNPTTDAVVASSSNPTVPLFQSADHGSGSNATPLGVRVQNQNEIDLDLEDDTQHAAPSTVVPDRAGHDDNDDGPGPQYLDTSRPSAPVVDQDEVQSQIDNIVGVPADQEHITHPLPPRPEWGTGSQRGRGGNPANRGRGQGQGRGGHHTRDNWAEDYYDPRFITNPWERLEKKLGLEPLCSWISWEEAKSTRV